MSLLTRLQQYIGANAVNASEALNASAKLHFRLIYAEDVAKLATEQTVSASGLDVDVTDIILSVHNGSRQALLADASQAPSLSDEDSLNAATSLSPRYYYKDQKLYVLPSPSSTEAKAYILAVSTVDPAGNAISWLPDELEEASIIRAALIELQGKADSELSSLTFSIDTYQTDNTPSTPVLADVVEETVSAATISAVSDVTAPSVATSTASATSVTATTAAVNPTLGSFPTITVEDQASTLLTEILAGRADLEAIIARIKQATGDTTTTGNENESSLTDFVNQFQPKIPSYDLDTTGIDTGSSGTNGSLVSGTNAATITDESLTDFDDIITEITTRLSNEDDVEVSQALVAQANQVLSKFQAQVQDNIQTHRQKLETFRTELERDLREAELGIKDRELDLRDKEMVLGGISAEVAQKNVDVAVDQIRTRIFEIKHEIQAKGEQLKIGRNELRSRERIAESQVLSTHLQTEIQALNSIYNKYQIDVQKANSEFQGTLASYNGALQSALAKFNADVQAKLQDAQLATNVAVQNAANALQANVSDAQLEAQIEQANLSKDLQLATLTKQQADQIALANAANDLQAKISNSQNALAIFNAEAQIYGQQVGLYVQGKQSELQQAVNLANFKYQRFQLLRQLYQDTLNLYITRGRTPNAEAPTQNN